MPIQYVDRETAILTPAQRTKFVTFVTGIWPGAVGDIKTARLTRQGGDLVFTVAGTMTVTAVGELPPPPFDVDIEGGNYIYDDSVSVVLNVAQTTAFVDFVSDTWSGVPGDVEVVSFRRVSGGDVVARFDGTKTVATVGDLPDRKLRIRAVT